LQTSDAVEVGTVQLGAEALALAAILNKQMGLSLGHTVLVSRKIPLAFSQSRPQGQHLSAVRLCYFRIAAAVRPSVAKIASLAGQQRQNANRPRSHLAVTPRRE
jgi:hypothetical protein